MHRQGARTVLRGRGRSNAILLLDPVRNRSKHVWSFWSNVMTRLKAAHKEHYRSGAHRDAPPPLRPLKPALGAPGSITAQSRDANRLHHCSGDVLEDVPY